MMDLNELESFLNNFKVKLKIWEILILSRPKNIQTIADLEIRKKDVQNILGELNHGDYSEGPISDVVNGGPDLWIFGKEIKGKEVYIKITLGQPNNPTICISFHFSDFPMYYPFK